MEEKEKFEANKKSNGPFLRALAVLMKEKGINQAQVAELLKTKSGTFSDYKNGKKRASQEMYDRLARAFDGRLPSSYAGTTGQLSASIFGLCSDDYTTGVTVTALDGSNETIASVALEDVPMRKNVTTQYSGPLFSRQQIFSLTAADSWGDDVVMTW